MKENLFTNHNPLGLGGLGENKEKLDISVRVTTPDDWKIIQQLRQKALSGKDRAMFNSTLQMRLKEKFKGEDFWRKELSRPDQFFILSFSGSETAGMARAEQKTQDRWHVGWLYVVDGLKGGGIGKKMTAFRLKQIINRGGKVASGFIKDTNEINTRNTGNFGMIRVDSSATKYPKEVMLQALKDGFFEFEIDLTNSEVIKKIDEVLNER